MRRAGRGLTLAVAKRAGRLPKSEAGMAGSVYEGAAGIGLPG